MVYLVLIDDRGSKVDFVRVDRIWDSNRHNYVLKATAEDPDLGEYDQYAFQVRRIFDWENKYINTVLDIKSKALKEALKDVMDEVKGVSFAEETPVIDPNMIFLYLEELRTHMKRLKKKSKTETKKEKKNKKKFSATTKTKHLKVLIKYLDKDYAETKKTLYPLLENNTITFDLLWALFKSNEIAYCPTYGNPDEPRAFKIEYANLVRIIDLVIMEDSDRESSILPLSKANITTLKGATWNTMARHLAWARWKSKSKSSKALGKFPTLLVTR